MLYRSFLLAAYTLTIASIIFQTKCYNDNYNEYTLYKPMSIQLV